MITLRCTRRAASWLEKVPIPNARPGTSALGDWYVNVIGTAGGDFFIFVNERSLLTVTVPASEPMTLHLFVMRVANLLSMLGVNNDAIERELEHFRDLQVGKTEQRSVLGSMNDIAYHVQLALEDGTREKPVSLSELERYLAEMPMGALGYRYPRDVGVELLACGSAA